jgi:hypothetical protein
MITYHCDGCGKDIPLKALRYTVTIDVKAAYDKKEISLAELVQDHKKEILDLIEQLESKSADEVESSVFKRFKLDLCPSCQRAYLKNPIHFHREQAPPKTDFDIDVFLRSLDNPEPE